MSSIFPGIPDENANTGFARRPSGCQPGTQALYDYVRHEFGGSNLGCFSNSSYLSSGGMSWHMFGKAGDPGFNWYDADGARRALACFNWLIAHAVEIGLQQTIGAHEIWDVSYGRRAYHHDDHMNHVHFAISFAASQTWRSPGVHANVPVKPEVPPEMDQYIMQDTRVKEGLPAKRLAVGNFTSAKQLSNPDMVTRIKSYRFPNGASPLDTMQTLLVDPLDMDFALKR